MDTQDATAPQEGPEKRTIYVGSLPSNLTEEAIVEFFSSCGPVIQTRLAGDPTHPTRFGFIEFATVDGAQKACAMSGVELDGRKLRIMQSKTPIAPAPANATQTGAAATRPLSSTTLASLLPGQVLTMALGGPFVLNNTSAFMPTLSPDRAHCTVYVTGIDPQLGEEQLIQLFNLCGSISNIRLCGDTDKPSRFAFIEFMTREAAMTAIGLTGVVLGTMPLRVQPSKTAILGPRPATSLSSSLTDPTHQEKTARTLYVGGVDTKITEPQLIKHFSTHGTVTKLCMAGNTSHPTRFAFVEFATAEEAIAALELNGTVVGDFPIKVNPSKSPITGPKPTSAILPSTPVPVPAFPSQESPDKKRKRSSSRSPDRASNRRTRIRSRSRSRDRCHGPTKSPSPVRTRSRGRSRSRSPVRYRTRSPRSRDDRDHHHRESPRYDRSRSRSRDRYYRRSRSPVRYRSRSPRSRDDRDRHHRQSPDRDRPRR